MTGDGVLWWGYKDTQGKKHVKRYFDQGDLIEARASDFVETVYFPKEFETREEAVLYFTNHQA